MALSENSRGALMMALAMAAFTCNDALTKEMTAELSIPQIMLLRGLMTMTVVYVFARSMGTAFNWRVLATPLILLRTFCEIGATLTFLTALIHNEFGAVSSILQSLPLIVTLGAALFLGEQVGWRRWTAIGIGLVGVLIIIRPGPQGFNSASLYAVAAVMFTAVRDLVTRRIAVEVPTVMVTFFTCLANTVVGALLLSPMGGLISSMGGWRPVSLHAFELLVAGSLLVVAGYQAVVVAMRSGEISFIAPFRYTSLVWGLTIAVIIFGERLDATMLAGAAIVIASGLYTFYRERKRQKEAAFAAERAIPARSPRRAPVGGTD